ncbi:uncharacterized protein si:ch211-170d8.2 [Hypanus sabinus]|uniref:uncharacterized protein si:ch211-170d8.2 n=1 Tax=Hypanus sabinus TaxID=79690 RepID=UPI0028C4F00C|nr:uncharacterized protein si:ch211-170d8.2 [Hypanus sabinus]
MHRSTITLCLLFTLLHVLCALPRSSRRHSRSSSLEDEDIFYNFLSGSLEMDVEEGKRIGRRETVVGRSHLHCFKPSETWSAAPRTYTPFSGSVQYRVTVTTAPTEPPWKVFPLWHLMMFMKRFYSCCKLGYPCKKIKGYQGRLLGPGNEMEFFLRPEYLFVNVLRAQLHVNIANPDRVVLEAEIRVKTQGMTVVARTRNTLSQAMAESELAFDTLFLFKMMKEELVKEESGTVQFLLILRCFQNHHQLNCHDHGVIVLRAPFIVIGYV